ncbi:MAG: PLP-dependent aminotransferase family protein [Desulfopila sp.]
MEQFFAKRMAKVPRSFIREILKVSLDPQMINFAGGMPNKRYFPVPEIQAAADRVFAECGRDVLQYANSEGLFELRKQIADRYRQKKGIEVSPEDILITNGSQQGLDLLGKALIDDGDGVLIEEPGYLGAIQALSTYCPEFCPVGVGPEGLDLETLADRSAAVRAKLLYIVPNFQNPSGISYSEENRRQVAEVARTNDFLVVEDDPYGELRFGGEAKASLAHYAPERTILLGSFSKIVAPGFRLGWLAAPRPLYDKLLIAKQAADLHTASVGQHIVSRYLADNEIDRHIERIIAVYGRQCRAMVEAADRHLAKEVRLWVPEGGMFLWGHLPAGQNALKLLDYAIGEKVAFVPGAPFYIQGGEETLRLNFSCSDETEIEEGMKRLSRAYEAYRQAGPVADEKGWQARKGLSG